ncbi:MAG: DUF4197 domain-containing protein [Pseudomonadota bacterium]
MSSPTFSRRGILGLLPAGLLAGCSTDDINSVLGQVIGGADGAAGLSSAEAASGIRAALDQGITTAIAQVGRQGGYFDDPLIQIGLPSQLEDIRSQLGRIGLSGPLDEMKLQLNRGAEAAAPQARSIFGDAVKSLSISDALGIVNGGPRSATDYFQRQTTPALTSLFTPVMERSLQQAGAIQTYDNLAARLNNVPFAPELASDTKADLIRFGVEGGLGGLFTYIGKEEEAIRENPVRRTSEILRRVFG